MPLVGCCHISSSPEKETASDRYKQGLTAVSLNVTACTTTSSYKGGGDGENSSIQNLQKNAMVAFGLFPFSLPQEFQKKVARSGKRLATGIANTEYKQS